MGLITKMLKGTVSKILDELKVKNINSVYNDNPFRNQNSKAKYEAMAMVNITYAVIQKIVTYMNKTEILYGIERNDEIQPLPDNHWLNELFKNPNTVLKIDMHQILTITYNFLEYYGNAYLRIQGRTPEIITPLNNANLKIKENKDGSYKYEYSVLGNKQIIPALEVLHIKTLFLPKSDNKNWLIEGYPADLKSCKQSTELDYNSLSYINDRINSGNLPPLAISTESTLTDKLFTQIKKRAIEALGDGTKFLALDNGTMLSPFEFKSTFDPKLVQNSISYEMVNRICMAFGVPTQIVTGQFNQGTTVAIDRLFHEFKATTIEERLQVVESAFTMYFKQFEPDIVFYHKPFEFEDPEQKLKRQQFELNNGITSVNELRQEQGKQDIAGGDVYNLPNQQIESTERMLKFNKVNIFRKGLDQEILKTYVWKLFDEQSMRNASKIKKAWQKYFKGLNKRIISDLEAQYNKTIDTVDKFTLIQKVNDEVFDISDEIELATEQMTPLYADLSELMVQSSYELVETQIDFDIDNWILQINTATQESVGKIADSINSVHDDLRETIQDIIDNNKFETSDNLLKLITDATNDKFSKVYTRSRAEMIAETTSTVITSTSQRETWKTLGFKNTWLSRRDGKVRDTHRKVDGKQADQDGFFKVGSDSMRSPGTGSVAKENVRCRCSLFPILE